MRDVFEIISIIFSMLDRTAFRTLLLSAALLSVATMFEVIGIGLVLPIVQLMTIDTITAANGIIYDISRSTGVEDPIQLAKIGVFCLIIMVALKAAFTVFTNYWILRQIIRGVTNFMSKLFLAYLCAPIPWHHKHSTAYIMRCLKTSSDRILNQNVARLGMLAGNLVLAAAITVILIVTSPVAAALCLVTAVAGFYMTNKLLQKPTLRLADQDHEFQLSENRILMEAIESVRDTRVLARENHFLEHFLQLRRQREPFVYMLGTLNIAPRYIFEILTAISIFVVFMYLSATHDRPSDVVAVLALYGVAAMRLLPTVSQIVVQVNSLRVGLPAARELRKEIEFHGKWIIKDGEPASLLPPATRRIDLKQGISFENVDFKYGDDSPVLKNLSCKIQARATVGIVGPSGSGKSTLIGLLIGFYQQDKGRILFDGTPIDPALSPYERSIGWVPQKVFLSDDSIRRNIAFGLADSQIDGARIESALKQAQLFEFVQSLPEGLETKIGERGVRLSGGQQQRLAIARALYSDPDILILDEATSSLDLETEAEITAVINSLRGQKTVIIIAHRLSTIRHCDNILFLKNGQATASGTFDDLAGDHIEFAKLVELAGLTAGPDSNGPTASTRNPIRQTADH